MYRRYAHYTTLHVEPLPYYRLYIRGLQLPSNSAELRSVLTVVRIVVERRNERLLNRICRYVRRWLEIAFHISFSRPASSLNSFTDAIPEHPTPAVEAPSNNSIHSLNTSTTSNFNNKYETQNHGNAITSCFELSGCIFYSYTVKFVSNDEYTNVSKEDRSKQCL